MSTTDIVYVIILGFAAFASGFFSGSEIAMVSADRVRLRERAARGERGARLAEAFLSQPEVLLATTLMGTNLALVTFSVAVALALLGSGSSAELRTTRGGTGLGC